jgi:hypothetical protein
MQFSLKNFAKLRTFSSSAYISSSDKANFTFLKTFVLKDYCFFSVKNS